MRENRLSGSEGGVARKRHPYPYQPARKPFDSPGAGLSWPCKGPR